MRLLLSVLLLALLVPLQAHSYERNKAVPVQQVLFGNVDSVRNITEQELVQDRRNGWATFGGAMLGGVIGNQFGGGSGRTASTVLGSIIGGSMAHRRYNQPRVVNIHLVELLITVEETGEQYMVVQDKDNAMLFQRGDAVRLIYLGDNTVRVDKAY